jgi:hypothetical protein
MTPAWIAASATAAVPWMSSLKLRMLPRCRWSRSVAWC